MNPLLSIALRIQSFLRAALMMMCRVFPIQENKVVFVSFSGKSYSDNPKAIYEALAKLRPDADCVWLYAKSATAFPGGVRTCRVHSARAIFELATARVWVDNMPKPLYTRKRRGQFYVQTWHGDRGFKKMLYDAPDHPKGKPVLEARICDLMTSGSTFCEGTYRTGFRYHGEILRRGCPRNDVLLNPPPEMAGRVKASLGLGPLDKLLLYAPTMRNDARRLGVKQQIQSIDLIRTLDALDARLGGPFKCAVRAHSTQLGLDGYPKDPRVVDATAYEDMADLLLAADVLITDYSSSASDFVLTGRPVVLFQDDAEHFAASERSFYFDIRTSPYVIAASQRELEAYIARLTPEMARENDQAVLAFYGAYETGNASLACAERISGQLGKHPGRRAP